MDGVSRSPWKISDMSYGMRREVCGSEALESFADPLLQLLLDLDVAAIRSVQYHHDPLT